MEEDKRANQDKNDGTHQSKSNKQEPPTNLLVGFLEEKNQKDNQSSNPEPPQEPDLNLSLCLSSIDNETTTLTLTRSSSIAGVMNLRKDSCEPERSFLSLERSCSLPTDAERLHRMINLRELQTMKKDETKQLLVEGKGKEKCPPLPPKVASWPAASPSTATAPAPTIVNVKEEPVIQTITGPEVSTAANAASGLNSSSELTTVGPLVIPGTNSNEKPVKTEPENPHKRTRISYRNFQDNGMEVMRQMPSVSTTGDGPNGRKVEGFLYRYLKGHVSIVCVCHGSFLSPAEFVKHAGGRDVPNPMKHITVYSTFSV